MEPETIEKWFPAFFFSGENQGRDFFRHTKNVHFVRECVMITLMKESGRKYPGNAGEESMDLTEQKLISLIDARKEEILAYAGEIARHPEPGFEEYKTAEKTADMLKQMGYPVKTGLAGTGVRADWKEKSGPSVMIIGELDAIGCKNHPMADAENKTAHACGHHAQLAAMIGAAMALSDPEIREKLCGTVSFLAVPAEEYIDAEKRAGLRKQGIEFASGKSELIRRGEFDDTDIIMTTHVHMVPVKEDLYLGNPSCNGFTAEKVTVRGKPAHAAIDPWNGVNALSIASSAIQMMGLMRETFREEDHARLHNVIRKAGDVVNSVPDEAIVETKVRASSLERIQEIRKMTDRAYDGAAYAFGGKIEREILQGYMPVLYRSADRVLLEAAEALAEISPVTYRMVTEQDFNNACTDVGDLTHLFPVLNFTFSGFQGHLHGEDFCITDPEKAYLLPAKMLALSVYRLLRQDGEEARRIIDSYTPVFDREGYTRYVRETIRV